MEYNPFQHQDQTNSETMHAQECTYVNDILYFFCVQIWKKKKEEDRPTDPPNFQAIRANKHFIF